MQRNVVTVLLAVCCTLLAINLLVLLRNPQISPAHGQGVGLPTGQVAIAAVQNTSNDPWIWVYDVGGTRLACYTAKNQGIELKGVRNIAYDMKLEELSERYANARLKVAQVKAGLDTSKDK